MKQKMNSDLIRLVIVEDDTEVRMLTLSLINNFYSEWIDCVGAFGSAEAFSEKVATLKPNVVLMDITLPAQSGTDCVRQLHLEYPEIEFLMFTIHTDTKEVFDSLAAGATGYVLKGAPPEQLVAAIREVNAGGSPMSRQIARMLTRSFERTEPTYPELEKLTPQEKNVLESLSKGYAYKEIAELNCVSESTIKSQAHSIYRKLEVHSRTEALNKVFGRRE